MPILAWESGWFFIKPPLSDVQSAESPRRLTPINQNNVEGMDWLTSDEKCSNTPVLPY